MAHRTVFYSETGIVETTLEGAVTFDEVAEVIAESTRLSRENKSYLWLMDCREANLVLSAAEIYDLSILISRAAASLDIAPLQIKRALVVRRLKADFVFARTIAESRAQRLDLFQDMELAETWLTA